MEDRDAATRGGDAECILSASLAQSDGQRNSLAEQLEQAYDDYQSLNVQLEGLKTEQDRQAETEALLRGLLLEREAQTAAVETRLRETKDAAEAQRREQRSNEANLTSLLAVKATELESALGERDQRAEQERLLQALLAERAAKLAGLEVQLSDTSARNDTLGKELAGVERSRKELATSESRLRTELLKLRVELARYEKVASMNREQVERILQAERNLERGLDDYLTSNQIGIKRERQRLVLQLSDRILFDSGSAEIKDEGLAVLRRVGEVIRSGSGNLNVQIGGHTDNVPVTSRGGALGTNWGISAARAVNVVRFLEAEVGVDSSRLSASATVSIDRSPPTTRPRAGPGTGELKSCWCRDEPGPDPGDRVTEDQDGIHRRGAG